MSDNFLKDGTGKGYLAKVDSVNRLRTFAVTEPLFDVQAFNGEAWNVNTELQTISSASETPILYFKNNEAEPVAVVGWFIGVDAAGATFPGSRQGIMRVYAGVTGVTGGTDLSVLNRNVGSNRVFDITATLSPTWTPTGTPLLYQTQGTGRTFGTVYLVVPRGGTLMVTYEWPTYTSGSPLIYTGFTGYVEED